MDVGSVEVNNLATQALIEIDTFLYANCTPLSSVKQIKEADMFVVDAAHTDYFLKLEVELMFASCALNKNSKSCSASLTKTSSSSPVDSMQVNGWSCL